MYRMFEEEKNTNYSNNNRGTYKLHFVFTLLPIHLFIHSLTHSLTQYGNHHIWNAVFPCCTEMHMAPFYGANGGVLLSFWGVTFYGETLQGNYKEDNINYNNRNINEILKTIKFKSFTLTLYSIFQLFFKWNLLKVCTFHHKFTRTLQVSLWAYSSGLVCKYIFSLVEIVVYTKITLENKNF